MTQRRGGVNINMHSFINFSFDCKRIFFGKIAMSIGQTFFFVNYINVTILLHNLLIKNIYFFDKDQTYIWKMLVTIKGVRGSCSRFDNSTNA